MGKGLNELVVIVNKKIILKTQKRNMTSDHFKNHTVFEKLEQLKQTFSKEENKSKIDNDSFLFFDAAYQHIIDRLKISIPILVQEAELTSLANETNAATTEINNFIGNSNIGHIHNAINNLNTALSRVRTFPFPIKTGDFDFSRTVSTFQTTIETSYRELEIVNYKLKEDLKQTQTELDIRNIQIATIQQQLSAKESEIQNVLAQYITEFEAIKTNLNNLFEAEKKKNNDNIEADRKQFKEQFEIESEENKKSFEYQKTLIETTSNDIIKNLNSKLDEAKKIVNIVGNVGATGNFQNIANHHRKIANTFRWIALSFMVLMSALLIWSIVELTRGDFDLSKSIVRILAASILTYPAIYTSRESTKHRKLETHNRNLELELASIGPFIELLPEDKKQTIKEELVKRYFGNNILNTEEKEEEGVSIEVLQNISKIFLQFIKK